MRSSNQAYERSGVLRGARVVSGRTSGYTGRPFRWQQVRIAPVGSFISVTEPLGQEVCDQLMPTRRMASDSKNLLYYFRITPDNRLLFGGRARFAMPARIRTRRAAELARAHGKSGGRNHAHPNLLDASGPEQLRLPIHGAESTSSISEYS